MGTTTELQELMNTIRLIQLTNYGIVCCCTFLGYDIALNVALEVNYIWSAKWTFPKITYIYLRYYGLVYLVTLSAINTRISPSVEVCRHYWIWMIMTGPATFSIISNIILILRIHALYNRSPKVLFLLGGLVVGQTGVTLYFTIRNLVLAVSHTIPSAPGIPWPGCLVSPFRVAYDVLNWVSMSIVTTVFFVMTLWNFVMATKDLRRMGLNCRRVRRVSPIFVTFVWDGTVYYFLIIVTVFVGMILSMVQGPITVLGCASLPMTVFSFATSRLILNLRMSAAHHIGDLATWKETLSMQMPPIESSIDLEIEGLENVELGTR